MFNLAIIGKQEKLSHTHIFVNGVKSAIKKLCSLTDLAFFAKNMKQTCVQQMHDIHMENLITQHVQDVNDNPFAILRFEAFPQLF